MTDFVHFIRFVRTPNLGQATLVPPLTGAVAYFGDAEQGIRLNQHEPTAWPGKLTLCPGDVLRWLVPKSDLWGKAPETVDVAILPVGTLISGAGTPFVPVGVLRRQDSETYTEFVLAVDSAPTAVRYRQFSLLRTIPNPVNPSTTLDVPILGTFRSQTTDYESYVAELTKHLESYAHAPVLVIREGKQLRVRVYHSDRFMPVGERSAEKWRVGLGPLPDVGAFNENRPSLTARKITASLTIPGTDTYEVEVGRDIAEGNVFALNGKTYTAKRFDKSGDVLTGLGLNERTTNGRAVLKLTAGTPARLSVSPGSYRTTNTNRPTINVLYDSDNGGGMWKYKVEIGTDLAAGNLFSVGATGVTTKSVVALSTDTPTTIAAQFNTSGGFILLPAGQSPVISVLAGGQTITNTNSPALFLPAKATTEARTVDRYQVFVGASLQPGNVFVLDTKSYTATASDTPATIAQGLGFGSMPFNYDVGVNVIPEAFARLGYKYREPDHVAPVRLIQQPTTRISRQCVAEVKIPANTLPGRYQFWLRDAVKPVTSATDPPPGHLLAQSNILTISTNTKGTAIVRFGEEPIDGGRAWHGFDYTERGLMQQIRLPVRLDAIRQLQNESQYQTLAGDRKRSAMRVDLTQRLLTAMQPDPFHRAMLATLKHARLTVDGVGYTCLENYSQSDASGNRQLMQGETTLMLCPEIIGPRVTLSGCDALRYWLESNDGRRVELTPDLLPTTADYNLIALCPGEAYNVTVYVNGRMVLAGVLTPSRLNRLNRLRIGPTDLLAIEAQPDSTGFERVTESVAGGSGITTVTNWVRESVRRPGDFGRDFNADFFK